MTGIIQYGVLGAGRIATRMVSHIRESGNSLVSAVAASSIERAAAFASELRVERHYGDYLSLLRNDSIDAVYIALPNSMHFELCKQALEHGKHVLCEKPFVLESRQIDVLETLSKNNKLKIMECFWYRFHPLVDMIADSIKKELGTPLVFNSTFSFINAIETDMRWNPALGGGALMDLMCYHIDAVNYLFTSELSQLTYLEAFSRQRNGVDANISVEALFSEKFLISVSSSIDRESINRTTIVGTESSLLIPNLRISPDVQEACFYLIKSGKIQKICSERVNAYARMVEAFSNSIIKDTPTPVTISESKKNLILLETIKDSLRLEMADRVALYPKAKLKLKTILSAIKKKMG